MSLNEYDAEVATEWLSDLLRNIAADEDMAWLCDANGDAVAAAGHRWKAAKNAQRADMLRRMLAHPHESAVLNHD